MGAVRVGRRRTDVPHSVVSVADALQSKRYVLAVARTASLSGCKLIRISGLNAGLVLQLACQEQNVDPLVRNKTIDILARHIGTGLHSST